MFSAGQYLRLALAVGVLGKVGLTTLEKEPTAPECMIRVEVIGSIELPHTEKVLYETYLREPWRNVAVVSALASAWSCAVSGCA